MPEKAEAHLRQVVAIVAKLADDSPTVPEYRRLLAVSHNNLGAMLQRVADSSLHEIERLVHELQSLRDLLETEGERVQREIAEYVQLSKSSMQSTKIIAESLAQWKSVADKHRA